MSGGKNGAKIVCFLHCGARAAKCEKLLQNTVCLCTLSCQNIANTRVFGWFALKPGSHTSEENTGIYETF